MPDPAVLTVSEIVTVLRLGRTKVNELIHTGQLRRLAGVGRRVLVPVEEVERFRTTLTGTTPSPSRPAPNVSGAVHPRSGVRVVRY